MLWQMSASVPTVRHSGMRLLCAASIIDTDKLARLCHEDIGSWGFYVLGRKVKHTYSMLDATMLSCAHTLAVVHQHLETQCCREALQHLS